jgi:hypothetical protein
MPTSSTASGLVPSSTERVEALPISDSPPPRLDVLDPLQLPPTIRYPRWARLALEVGFPISTLPTVDLLIHRESRGLPQLVNRTRNRDGSHDWGLLQINGRSWCEPTRYYPSGYLQTLRILNTCEELLDPLTNLKAAHAIWVYAKGFGPWGA